MAGRLGSQLGGLGRWGPDLGAEVSQGHWVSGSPTIQPDWDTWDGILKLAIGKDLKVCKLYWEPSETRAILEGFLQTGTQAPHPDLPQSLN
jgi:hypothetical protein